MANIIQAATPAPFDVSFGDTGLFVRMSIFDMSSGSPVFLSTVNMAETPTTSGSYGCLHTFAAGSYMVTKRVYTDGTYTTLDPGYSPGSEAFQAVVLSSGGGTSATGVVIIGKVSTVENLIAQVVQNQQLTAVIVDP